MADDVLYAQSGGRATITINRPDRLNALRPVDLGLMADLLARADRDPSVGVVVVTGEGNRSFCAGGDLTHVAGEDRYQGERASSEVIRWVAAFRECTKPVVARVRGHCIGLGNELNLLCDLTIADTSATFGQAGPRVGSVPCVGGTQMLPLVSGMKRAKEILFLCRTYSGEEAVRMGLANVVVSEDLLDAEVDRWCEDLLAMSPQSLRISKLSLSYLFDLQWPAVQHGFELTRWMIDSPEMQEGAQAFMEKRKPEFRR